MLGSTTTVTTPRPPVGRRRIAVVGAGVSGLVAARELHRAGHEVHVFEAGAYPGASVIALTSASFAFAGSLRRSASRAAPI